MLSYQHAYHAGNPADVHKHMAVAEMLRLLTKKDRGISYLETHAGRGRYDLTSEEAAKTGEAAEGILRLHPPADSPYGEALARVRAAHGAAAYPGSPALADALLRPQDRLILMEKHPREVEALRAAMRGTIAEIHHRDGYEGVLGISPAEPRRGLVLIDPSYEIKTEYEQAGRFALTLHARWPEAAIAIWYPVLAAGRHEGLANVLAPLDPMRDEVAFELKGGRGMIGSGLLIIGAPWGTGDALARVFEAGQPLFRRP